MTQTFTLRSAVRSWLRANGFVQRDRMVWARGALVAVVTQAPAGKLTRFTITVA